MRICSIRRKYGPTFCFFRGFTCRYPGGSGWRSTFFKVLQCCPVSRKICRLLTPSMMTLRRISAHCSISRNILLFNLEVLHFSTAAPLGATRRTFQPPFTPEGILWGGSRRFHALRASDIDCGKRALFKRRRFAAAICPILHRRLQKRGAPSSPEVRGYPAISRGLLADFQQKLSANRASEFVFSKTEFIP